MRRVRDRKLADPFRGWINQAQPLPAEVILLPRTINVSMEGWRLAFPGLMLAGMGVVFIVAILKAGALRNGGGLAFLMLGSTVLFGVPLWIAHKLWRAVGARSEGKAGTLRQGVLVGPEGILVRLMPNRCYAIPLEQFVTVEEWTGGSEDGADYLKITTRSGVIDLEAEHLSVGAAEVNEAVAAVRRRVAILKSGPAR